MIYLAWIVYIVSTVSASIFAAAIPIMWHSFVVSVVFCLLSAGYIFVLRHRQKNIISTDPGNYMEIFKNIMAETIILDQRMKFISAEELKQRIEKLQAVLDEFVSYRDKLQLEFGMKRYGEIYSSFSLGELYINRAWSAIVDSNLGEAQSSISKARKIFAVIGS